MSVGFSCLMVLFSSSISLLTFCLVLLLITERGVLKLPTIIADLSISPFNSVSFYFMYFAALSFVDYKLSIVMSSW